MLNGGLGRSTVVGAPRVSLVVLLAGLTGLVACRPATEVTPNTRRVLRAAVSLPAGGSGSFAQEFVVMLTNERLLLVGDDGRPVPRLIERWSVSDDRLTWTFTLRPALTFHDGSPLTADVLREILLRRAQAPATSPGLRDISTVTVRDAQTFVVSLRQPSALFLDDLAAVEVTKPGARTAIGAGPFETANSANDPITVQAFAGYYQGPPPVERLEVRVFPTVRAAWAAMMRDEEDVLFEVGREAVEFVEAESSVQVYSFMRPWVFALTFNVRRSDLARREVRQAVSLAVDREEIVRTALRGRGRPADGFLWPFHWAIDRGAPAYGHNPERARRLLDQSGLPVKDAQDRRRRLVVHCLIPQDLAPIESIALVLQKQLMDVGIDLEVDAIPLVTLTERLQTGDFDAFILPTGIQRTLSMPYQFLHSPVDGQPVFVDSGYRAADATLDRMRHARTDDDVRSAVRALQQVLYDDPPGVFIAWDERARAVSRRFVVPALPGHDILPNLWQLRPAPGRPAN